MTSTLTGTRCSRFDTLALLAQALGQRIQLADRAPRAPSDPDAPVDNLAAVEGSWEAAGLLAGGWEVIIVSEVGLHAAAVGLAKYELALRVGLRKNTVTELWTNPPSNRWTDPGAKRWANVRTLAALAAYFDTRLELVDRTEPWAVAPVLTPDEAAQPHTSAEGPA